MCEKLPIIYEDDNHIIIGDHDDDESVTLVLKNRGITILFIEEDWPEFLLMMETVLRSKMGIEV